MQNEGILEVERKIYDINYMSFCERNDNVS